MLGYVLHRGGANVDFLVDAGVLDTARAGFRLHEYGLFRYSECHAFHSFEAFSNPADVAGRGYDQIWFAGTRSETRAVFDELVGFPRAIFVHLDPDERPHLEQRIDPARVVSGLMPIVAYHAPIPTETLAAGTAFWLAPAVSTQFCGEFASDIVRTVRLGGVSADVTKDIAILAQFNDALRIPLTMTLALHKWSLDNLRKSVQARQQLQGAIEELATLQSRLTDAPRPRHVALALEDWVLRAALFTAPRVLPLPVEPLLKHYLEQRWELTPEHLTRLIRTCIETGVQPTNLGELFDRWADNHRPPDTKSVTAVPKLSAPIVTDEEPAVPKLDAPIVDDEDEQDGERLELPATGTNLRVGSLTPIGLEEETPPPDEVDTLAAEEE